MTDDNLALLQRQLAREKLARRVAEQLLEEKSLSLYHSNEQLKQSEDQIRQVINLLPDAIWIEHQGRIRFVNQAALGLFNVAEQNDILGTLTKEKIPYHYDELMVKIASFTPDTAEFPYVTSKISRPGKRHSDIELFGLSINYFNSASTLIVARDHHHQIKVREAIELSGQP
jgi:PAS domain-containing protein